MFTSFWPHFERSEWSAISWDYIKQYNIIFTIRKLIYFFSLIALTTITPGSADKKIDALSLHWFLKFMSVNPDLSSWKNLVRLLKTAVFLWIVLAVFTAPYVLGFIRWFSLVLINQVVNGLAIYFDIHKAIFDNESNGNVCNSNLIWITMNQNS